MNQKKFEIKKIKKLFLMKEKKLFIKKIKLLKKCKKQIKNLLEKYNDYKNR